MPLTETIEIEELGKTYEVLAEMSTQTYDMILRVQKEVKVKNKKGSKQPKIESDEEEESESEVSMNSITELKRLLITRMIVNPKISDEIYNEMSANETNILFVYLQDKMPNEKDMNNLKKKVRKR